MGIVTRYVCDCCGEDVEDTDQFWKVGVYVQNYHQVSQWVSNLPSKDKLLHACRKCMLKFGFFISAQGASQDSPPPTAAELLEDVIRRLIQEELPNARD